MDYEHFQLCDAAHFEEILAKPLDAEQLRVLNLAQQAAPDVLSLRKGPLVLVLKSTK
jgi:hypothetical protein